MRILEINKFNYVRGGADKHFVDLAKLLENHGHEVAVFAMDHPNNLPSKWSEYFVSRVEYNEAQSMLQKAKAAGRIFWSFEARRKIRKLLDEFQPDIVHIHNIYHQISPSILPEIKKSGIPIVMTVHDWKMICPNYLLNCGKPYCRRCLPRRQAGVAGKYWHCVKNKCVKNSYLKSLICVLEMYFHRWLKIYEKNIDLYIAPSLFVKNILAEAGFPEKKIKVLPHFIEAKSQHAPRQPEEKYALYFGRVSKEKGADELVEIFRNLPIKLILAGHKDAGFAISDLPNINYVGFKTPAEIETLIQGSEFVVSASRLPETFGLIALEAIAQNRPFVGYDAGAYGEIVRNGQNGYLAKSREELTTRIGEMLINKGKKFVFDTGNFDPEKYYIKLIDIFQDLC